MKLLVSSVLRWRGTKDLNVVSEHPFSYHLVAWQSLSRYMAPLHLLAISLVWLLLLQTCTGRIYSKLSDLPTTRFDFVIIGSKSDTSTLLVGLAISILTSENARIGGAAGNVLANRLTENPHISVLVLEAGGSYVQTSFKMPTHTVTQFLSSGMRGCWTQKFLSSALSFPRAHHLIFTTTPQAALNNHTVAFPRGFMLGGSTSISKGTKLVA